MGNNRVRESQSRIAPAVGRHARNNDCPSALKCQLEYTDDVRFEGSGTQQLLRFHLVNAGVSPQPNLSAAQSRSPVGVLPMSLLTRGCGEE